METAQKLSTLPNELVDEAILLHSISLQKCKESIPKASIRDVGPELKARFLQTTQIFNSYFDVPHVMNRLRDLDTSSNVNFMARPNALPKFKMRLLMDDQTTAGSCESYLAMSYRCRAAPPESPPPGHLHLPICREVFAAVCSLVGPNEGLWFDTGCIDQDDQAEKEIAISVMDVLYKNAKRVIIVLRDVQLSDSEVNLLEGVRQAFHQACERHIQPQMQCYGFPPYMDGFELPELTRHPAFPDLAIKILSSEYFERAFCGQEFRVARRCSFLLPCELKEAATTFCFYTLDDSFVSTVLMCLPGVLCNPQALSKVLDLQGGFEMVSARTTTIQGVLVRKAYRNVGESHIRQGRDFATFDASIQASLRGDSLSQSFDDIFGMKAGGNPRIADENSRALDANKDKVQLVFNSVEHPLTVAFEPTEQGPPLTRDRCLSFITKVALASEDALGLCGRGGKLNLGPGQSTWIQRPKRHQADALSGPGSRLDKRIPFRLGTENGDEYIDIGLRFLLTTQIDESAFSKALAFLTSCEASGNPYTFTNELNIDRNNAVPPLAKHLNDMHEIKVGTLATLFQSRDIAEMSAILSTQPFSPSSHLSSNELDAIFDESFTLKAGVLNNPSLIKPVATALMSFVGFLVNMLQKDMACISYEDFYWRPRGVVLNGHLCLVMAPPETQLAVPDPVKWRECQLLSRCWLLSARNDDSCSSLTLVSATHLYSSAGFMENLEDQPPQELCRVFGQT